MPLRVVLSVIMVAIGLISATELTPARACAVSCAPINLLLTYLPGGLSNWGPETATGVAELVLAEGEVRGRVVGLPSLQNETYQAWLVNTQTDQALPFGHFNTDQQRAQFRFIVPEEIPDTNWNLFIITVEAAGGARSGQMGDKRAIGSFFPSPGQTGQQPRELPKTGADPLASNQLPSAASALAAPSPEPAAPPDWPRSAPANLVTTALQALTGLAAPTALGSLVGLGTGWLLRGRRRS